MSIQILNEETKEIIRNNIENIKREIASLSSKNGEVKLLAATKTVPASVINDATRECGISYIGENKVQELLEKYEELDLTNTELHFIGTLQTNKVKYIIDKVSLIHSVDSEKLAREIDKQARKIGKVMDILVEINIGREENKSGIDPDKVPEFLEFLSSLPNVRVRGLMTIAPNLGEKELLRNYFRETYSIFIDNSQKKYHNIDVEILSMGMTDSYVQAIEEGSNMVRIGSGIFGARDYSKK